MHKLSAVMLLVLSSCVARGGFQAGGSSTTASGPPPSEPAPAYPTGTDAPVAAPEPDAPVAAFPPGQWTLGQREHWKEAYDDAMQYINLMNETCKTTIAFHYEHESLRPLMTPQGLHARAKSFASDVAGIIGNICEGGPMQRQAVQQQIKTIVLGKPADRKHRIANGTLGAAVDETANPRQYYYDFRDWLKGAL